MLMAKSSYIDLADPILCFLIAAFNAILQILQRSSPKNELDQRHHDSQAPHSALACRVKPENIS